MFPLAKKLVFNIFIYCSLSLKGLNLGINLQKSLGMKKRSEFIASSSSCWGLVGNNTLFVPTASEP